MASRNTGKQSVSSDNAEVGSVLEGRNMSGPEPMAVDALASSSQANRRPRARIEAQQDGKDKQVCVYVEPTALQSLFGTEDCDVANTLLTQLIGTLHADSKKPIDESTVNAALGMLHEIGPRNGLEAMTAVMMVGSQVGAMETLRRAMHSNQTPAGRELYINLSTRLMKAFATQLEALNRGRGKATVQRVIVERVDVREGGQAIVGAIETKGARGDG